MSEKLIEKIMEVYTDNIMVKSTKEMDYLVHLAECFAVVRQYGMKLNPTKCIFGMKGGKVPEIPSYEKRNRGKPGESTNCNGDEVPEVDQGVYDVVLSIVLVKEDSGEHIPVYYVSKMLQEVELRYIDVKRFTLELVITTQKLRPHFQLHHIVVLTNQPLKEVTSKPKVSGRLVKWAIELGEFSIEFKARKALKAQVLAGFVLENDPGLEIEETNVFSVEQKLNQWDVHKCLDMEVE
ncbi:UNVERIFIED_CONTAM: hypothetical protein Sangu_0367400 [Sesamum angustifolium]|uniref:Reverse transcriptase RNase H-like domain-containing protein n=1 Tax=Sesamum angustifolium TaxID=2727405 RepID=A0AAW2QSS4_9LAMI